MQSATPYNLDITASLVFVAEAMSVRQIYDLQGLDGQIAGVEERLASIESRLGDRSALEALEERIASLRQRLREVELQRRSREMEVDSVQQKLQALEKRLYGGEVTNPRELEGMGKEQQLLRSRLEREEEQLLEVMVSQEEVEQALKQASAALDSEAGRWQREQGELAEERDAQAKRLQALLREREGVTMPLGKEDLEVYERLRASKGGQVVAKVERGLCRACGMTLPTHVVQQARTGKGHVFCPSCGRLLYVS